MRCEGSTTTSLDSLGTSEVPPAQRPGIFFFLKYVFDLSAAPFYAIWQSHSPLAPHAPLNTTHHTPTHPHTTLHCTALHYTTLHNTTLHYTTHTLHTCSSCLPRAGPCRIGPLDRTTSCRHWALGWFSQGGTAPSSTPRFSDGDRAKCSSS